MGFRDWEMAKDLERRIRALSVHPLVNAKADRNLREAYFNGLVFAALCDDFSVDESEKHLLTTIGSALGLAPGFVAEAIANTKSVAENNEAKYQAKALFDESLNELRKLPSDGLRRLFAAEFVKVRMLYPESEGELQEGLSKMGATIGTPVKDVLPSVVAIVKAGASAPMEDIDRASALLGDEVVKYFVVHEMGRIDSELERFRFIELLHVRYKQFSENGRTLPERLAAIVESDDTWPVEFKPEDYKPLFAAAGISDSDAAAFVAREMLPYMKRACERAKAQIGKVSVVHDSSDDEYHGAKFESVAEFRILFRYAFFVDTFVDLNGIHEKYYFIGPKENSSSYYSFSAGSGDITRERIGEERYQLLSGSLKLYPHELFDRLRCGWNIYEEAIKRYFTQWEELFAAIVERYATKV